VTSCDPLYSFTADEIRTRIDATFDALVDNARVAFDEFIWRDIESPEHLDEVRMAADFPERRGLRLLLIFWSPPLGASPRGVELFQPLR
jgi:hypothetical protein